MSKSSKILFSKSIYFFQMVPNFWLSCHKLQLCWFLAKKLANFMTLPWKLNNPYCHIEINTYFNVFNAISSSSFSLYLLSLIRHKKYLAQNSICCFRINWLRPDVGLKVVLPYLIIFINMSPTLMSPFFVKKNMFLKEKNMFLKEKNMFFRQKWTH